MSDTRKREEAGKAVLDMAEKAAAKLGKSTEKARREAAEQLRKGNREHGKK